MTTYYKGNNIGLSYNAAAGTWSFNNTPKDFIDPNAFSSPDPKFPTAPTTPTDPSDPTPDPCPPGYVYDETLKQCVPDPNYQNPFRQDNQGGGNEQPFQPGTGVELPSGFDKGPKNIFPYSTDAPTRAQQNEHMLLMSGVSLGWLQKDNNGNYVKVPFKLQAGDASAIGWGGMAIKYFNEKSYNDYFNILENGWQPEGKGLWDKFLRGNSVYSLKGGMKKIARSGPGGMDMEVYNYSPEFQEKINQAQSINNGMIDRDGNVNINADGKGGYYREDGKFVLNNGQVVSFGSLSAGLNYLANLEGSGLKLSDALRKRLGKALESQNIDWATLNKSGKSIDYLRNLVKTYKQEKVKTVDEEFVKPEVKKDDVATGVKEAVDLKDNGSQVQEDKDSGYSAYEQDTTPTGGSGSGSGFSYGTGSSEEYDKFESGSSSSSGSSNQQDTSAPNYPGNQSYNTPPPSSAAESFKQYGRF